MSGVEVIPATALDKVAVTNLIQLYLYDMTDDEMFAVEDDGRYGYDFLERFWRRPYLLRVGGDLAGFALVVDECPVTGAKPCWFVAEFFVLRGYRRRGVGSEAVAKLLARHPGHWHIGVMSSHLRSLAFWSHALNTSLTVETRALDFEGAEWVLHAFDTK